MNRPFQHLAKHWTEIRAISVVLEGDMFGPNWKLVIHAGAGKDTTLIEFDLSDEEKEFAQALLLPLLDSRKGYFV